LGKSNERDEKDVKNVLVLPSFGQEDLENYLFDNPIMLFVYIFRYKARENLT
jgi:hypothetical protein